MPYFSRFSIASVAALTFSTLSYPATANENTQDGDHIMVGAGVLLQKDPFLDSETQAYPLPLISIRQGVFYFEGTEAGVELEADWNEITPALSVFVAGRFTSGQDREKVTADAGARVSLTSQYGTISIGYQHDVTDKFNGGEAIARYSLPISVGSFTITPALQASWLDRKTASYMYGVTAKQRAKMIEKERDILLPISQISNDVWNFGGDITVTAQVGDHILLYGSLGGTYLDKSIRNSPAIDQEWEAEAVLGIAYSF